MELQEIRQYILEISGIDVLTKSRKNLTPTLRAIFIQVARKTCLDEYGKKITTEKIGFFLGLHHTTVLFHLRKNLKFHLGADPILKKIYLHYFKVDDFSTEYYKKQLAELKKELNELKRLINV